MSVRFLSGMRDLADDYDGYILDLWGVVHNGVTPYDGSLECMINLRRQGKPVLLLSNAPRTNPFVEEFLTNMGVTREHYDGILTSGDMTRLILERRDLDLIQNRGRQFFQIGATRDKGLEDGLGYTKVSTIEEADFIICTGLFDDTSETPEDYRDLLSKAQAQDLPMLCANPDLTVMRGEDTIYCAGSIAALYEELGGKVKLFGKPYQTSYDLALEKLGISDRNRVLAVGDAMRTDIKGATGAGIDSVLVAGGLHAEAWGLNLGDQPTLEQVETAITEFGFAPTAVIAHMTW